MTELSKGVEDMDLLPEVYPGSRRLLCHVRVDSPKSREEGLPQLSGATPSPYLHTFVERTRAPGGGLQIINPDLLPGARAVHKKNVYKRQDKKWAGLPR